MENGKHIRVLTINLGFDISSREVPLLRGAVIACIEGNADILYHNHKGDTTYRYSYPLIQYKRHGGKAAIVCIEEGADKIGQFLTTQQKEIKLGNRTVRLEMDSVHPQKILMQTWQDMFDYRLQHWIPLNSENYRRYQELEGLAERIALLENILKGNLLSMCKGLGIFLSEQLKVTITHLSNPRFVWVKGVRVMSFDVDFRSNLSIPNEVGIGKNASLGYGVIYRNRVKATNFNSNNNIINDE